jgi:hypothetical protein
MFEFSQNNEGFLDSVRRNLFRSSHVYECTVRAIRPGVYQALKKLVGSTARVGGAAPLRVVQETANEIRGKRSFLTSCVRNRISLLYKMKGKLFTAMSGKMSRTSSVGIATGYRLDD